MFLDMMINKPKFYRTFSEKKQSTAKKIRYVYYAPNCS